MDECPAGTSVAVDEWVDGLELRMSEGCMREYWQIIAVGERDEVVDGRLDMSVVG